MSLYQKYRPTSFDEVVGNKSVISSLKGLLSSNPPHAFLLKGPTGCGKTTLGRIIAAELGCQAHDIKEIDTADFRGIETARAIRHNAHFKALQGERRAWIIDECHKLTNEAQNALLKGLEDPPDHCYYILCTTEPEKLLDTVRGRCSIHTVTPLTVPEMFKLLARICIKEKSRLPEKVLDAIARRSSISAVESDERAACYPRHALQILEKVLVASPEEQLKVIAESDSIAANADSLVIEMLRKSGWRAVANVLQEIPEENIEAVRRGVLGYCRKVLLNGSNDIAAEIIDKFQSPFFDSGPAGLALSCYAVVMKNQ